MIRKHFLEIEIYIFPLKIKVKLVWYCLVWSRNTKVDIIRFDVTFTQQLNN